MRGRASGRLRASRYQAHRRATRRDFARLAAVLSGLMGAAFLWHHSGLIFNHTASMPVGFYRLQRVPRISVGGPFPTLTRGSTVVWCLPEALVREARRRGYLVRGGCPGDAEPILKVVAALAGDTVTVDSAGMRVNGRRLPNSHSLRVDSQGRRIVGVAHGTYIVPPGVAWLWSPHQPHSFDSRYFGGVPTSGFVGLARPLWTRPARPRPDP